MSNSSIINLSSPHETEIQDIIRYNDEYYIRATSPLADDRVRVLKQGDSFAVFDQYGNIQNVGLGEYGIFHEGTRFLSQLELKVGKRWPLLLNSNVNRDNSLFSVHCTNPDILSDSGVSIPRGSLHILRKKFLLDAVCYEKISISNYSHNAIDLSISFSFEADYMDIFEVRGMKRKERGKILPEEINLNEMVLKYQGLDGVLRKTRIHVQPHYVALTDYNVSYKIHLKAKDQENLIFAFGCEIGNQSPLPKLLEHEEAFAKIHQTIKSYEDKSCRISSSNQQFNDWIQRSLADMRMMITQKSEGPYPYAGVPWYCTVFGRDGVISALQMLWIDPSIARGVLNFLAKTQATELIPERDAEPGKILHEMRHGEMAALQEIPFGLYYGSIDSTPLFLILAGAYYERTGDKDFIRSIWKNILAALNWIDQYGDRDQDGFVEYCRQSEFGLVNQGWKDSQDSIFEADGSLAEAPIALCEVQSYVYAAKIATSLLSAVLGEINLAGELAKQAVELKLRFEAAFWCDDIGTFALALDGKKRPCRVSTSNAGHCLFSGIAKPEHARKTAELLLNKDFFSGWGIRTIPTDAARYNPMSYHNGSVWPHDNALIAYGMSRYRFKDLTLKIADGLFDASSFLDLYRLPELFCGFARQSGQGPTQYPVACMPQTWASGAVLLILQACLGLSINADQSKVYLDYPVLPKQIDTLRIENLQVGAAKLDLEIQRHPQNVSVKVLRKQGNVEIITIK